MNDIFGKEAGQVPLEELVENQALNVGLREAVMACLSKERISPLDLFWSCSERLKKPGRSHLTEPA